MPLTEIFFPCSSLQMDRIITRTIFPDSIPHLVTDLLKKTQNSVGLFLQKSFLSVEKWVSSHLCSGTHLLTQSLNSEEANLRSVAVSEKLFSFAPLLSCSRPKGALTQLQLQSDGSLLSPLCWTSGAGGPEPLHSCLWGEQGWQPALDKTVVGHRGRQQAQCFSLGSSSCCLSTCWSLLGKAGASDSWWPLCSPLLVPHLLCGAFVSQHD